MSPLPGTSTGADDDIQTTKQANIDAQIALLAAIKTGVGKLDRNTTGSSAYGDECHGIRHLAEAYSLLRSPRRV